MIRRQNLILVGLSALALAFAACDDEKKDTNGTPTPEPEAGDTSTGDGSGTEPAADGTNPEPAADGTEPAGDTPAEPAADGTEPAADGTEPAADGTEPAADTAEPAGACINAPDLALIEDDGCEDEPPPDTTCESDEARTCGQGCLASPDPKQCATDCVVEKTGLTTPCAACYADNVPCAVANGCVAPCLQDEVKCSECLCEKGCTKAFYDCSGLDSSTSTCENL